MGLDALSENQGATKHQTRCWCRFQVQIIPNPCAHARWFSRDVRMRGPRASSHPPGLAHAPALGGTRLRDQEQMKA